MTREDFSQPGKRSPVVGDRSKKARQRKERRHDRHVKSERRAIRSKNRQKRIRFERATDPNWGLPKPERAPRW